jgi:hypothetical protein
MYQLDSLPIQQLTGYAGTAEEKIVALVDAYAAACCKAYVTKVQTPEFVPNQQVAVALGRALREAIHHVAHKI